MPPPLTPHQQEQRTAKIPSDPADTALACLRPGSQQHASALADRRAAIQYAIDNWPLYRDGDCSWLWSSLLITLGADFQVLRSCALLAQQGPAGRVELNSLLWRWINIAERWIKFSTEPMAMQKDLDEARRAIDRPPPQQLATLEWHPGDALLGFSDRWLAFCPRNPDGTPRSWCPPWYAQMTVLTADGSNYPHLDAHYAQQLAMQQKRE